MKLTRRNLRRLIESVVYQGDIEVTGEMSKQTRGKADEFAERLKVATLGHIVATKDPGFHVQTPILKGLEALGGAGTNEEEIYAVFREIKSLEVENAAFELEDVARSFKGKTGVKSLSLYNVLKDELSESEIAKVEEAYPGCMTILERL